MQKLTLSNTSAASASPLHNRRVNKIFIHDANQESSAEDELLNVKDNFRKSRPEDDPFDTIGKRVAMKLRRLPKQQMLIAEKLINDTLFHAELGHLSSLYPQNYESSPQLYPLYIPPFPTSSFTHLNYIKHPFLFTSSLFYQPPPWYQIRPMYYGYYEDHNIITSTCSILFNVFKLLHSLYVTL